MEFTLTADEQAFREEVRAFIKREWGPQTVAGAMVGSSREQTDRQINFRRRLGETGWLTAWLPIELGGKGRSGMEAFLFGWELSAHGAPYPFFAVNVISRMLMRYGTESQKQRFLGPIARGEIDFALGLTEPDSGSDLASLKLSAVREGDHYVLNGIKIFTSHVTKCEYVWLATRTLTTSRKHEGITLFMVPTDSPGFSSTPLEVVSGGHTNITYYDNLVISPELRLGEENKGWGYIRESMDLDRAVGIQYGYLPVVFEGLTREISARRRVLGSRFELFKAELAELAIGVEATWLMCYRIGRMLGAGEIPHSEASVLKVFSSELRERMADCWIELTSALEREGDSLEPELQDAVEAFYLGTRPKLITGGTNEIQRTIIARHLGLPRYTQ